MTLCFRYHSIKQKSTFLKWRHDANATDWRTAPNACTGAFCHLLSMICEVQSKRSVVVAAKLWVCRIRFKF